MNTVYPFKTLNQLRPLLVGFRKANRLTQREVSKRLGITQETYVRLEANPGSASIERLFRVLTVLGVEMTLSSGSPSTATESAASLHERDRMCSSIS